MKNFTNNNYLTTIILSILVSNITVFYPPSNAIAQIVVTDPGNTAQNLLTAIRTLQSNINEAQSLAYELQNLQKLNYTSTADFTTKQSSFLSIIQSLKGTLSDATNAAANFQQAYPQDAASYNNANILSKLSNMQSVLNNSMTDSINTNAGVMDSIPATKSNMDNLISASNNSQGALEATQAGNQMIASLSSQLSQMNSQTATFQTAQMNDIAKREAQKAAYFEQVDSINASTPPGVRTPTNIPGNN